MKKRISLVATLASAVMLSASVIDWELPNLTSGNGTALEVTENNIVFLISQAGVNGDGIFADADVVSGTNEIEVQDEDGTGGTFTSDSLLSETTYYMAYVNDGKYYAISTGNGQDIVSITTPDYATADSKITPGRPGSPVVSIPIESFSVDENGAVRTLAPSVPEPATAAMALVGVAMLLRRRRVA